MPRLFTLLILAIFAFSSSCELPDKQGPVADFTIQPRFGDSLTVFHFDASNSRDNYTDIFRLKVRWDINSDGVWESDFSINKHFAFKFPGNGTYSISCEILDDQKNISSHTKIVQVAPVPRDSVFTDERDAKRYRAVFLFDRWWMSQNLNYGNTLEPGNTPSDNSIPEKYLYPDPAYDSLFGGYYTWDEASNYKKDVLFGICPEGWRLPREEDVLRIHEILWFASDHSEFLLTDGSFNLDFSLCGKYIYTAKTWDSKNLNGSFWVNKPQSFAKFHSWVMYDKRSGYSPIIYTDYQPLTASRNLWKDLWGNYSYNKVALPIRCIKDHEVN